MLALGEVSMGLRCFGGALAEALGVCCGGLVRRKVRFSFGDVGFWAQCSCGLCKARQEGRADP